MATVRANGALIRQLRKELKIDGKSASQEALAHLSADKVRLRAFKGEQPPAWINEFSSQWLSKVERDPEALSDQDLLTSLAYILGTSLESITLSQSENPYRGLKAFGIEDAEFFGGRDQEARAVFDRLAEHSLVGIIGASGSGKSSLAFAGVCPLIQKERPDWEILSLRIGSKPLESLFYALDQWLFPNAEERLDRPTRIRKFQDNIRHGNDALYHYLEGAKRDTDRTPVLVIDQWEELYTLCETDEDRENRDTFLQNLIEAVQNEAVRVLLTVRADFYDELLCSSPPFFDLLKPNLIDLQPMTVAQLRQAVEKPLEKTGFQFADGLIDRLLEDVGMDQGQLPILQFALSELWTNRDIDRNWVGFETYESLGGIRNIIKTHADKVMETELDPVGRKIAQITLPTLVNLGDHGNDVKLRVPLSQFGNEQQAILRKLSEENCRLLSIFRGADPHNAEQNIEYVELAHEELIRSWPALRGWLDENLEFHQQLSRLRASHRQYQDNNQDEDFLIPEGKPLEDARALLAEYGATYLGDLQQFIEASIDKWRARRDKEIIRERERRELTEKAANTKRRNRIALASLAVAAIGVGLTFFALQQQNLAELAEIRVQAETDRAEAAALIAQEQEERANIAAALAEQESARAMEAENSAKQLVELNEREKILREQAEAAEAHALAQAELAALSEARAIAEAEKAAASEASALEALFESTGRRLGAEALVIQSSEMTQDTAYLAAAMAVEGWRLHPTPDAFSAVLNALDYLPIEKYAFSSTIGSPAISRNGEFLAVIEGDQNDDSKPRTLHILRRSDQQVIETREVHGFRFILDFSPDGKHLILSDDEPGLHIYDIEAGDWHSVTSDAEVTNAVFSASGELAAIADKSGRVRVLSLWPVWDFVSDDNGIVTFEEGEKFFTVYDGTIELSGETFWLPMALDAQGNRLAIAGVSGRVLVVDLIDEIEPVVIVEEDPVVVDGSEPVSSDNQEPVVNFELELDTIETGLSRIDNLQFTTLPSFFEESELVVVGFKDGATTVANIDVAKGGLTETISFPKFFEDNLDGWSWHALGRNLIGGSYANTSIFLVPPVEPDVGIHLAEHRSWSTGQAISPDGKFVLSGGLDRLLVVGSPSFETSTLLSHWGRTNGASLTPSGNYFTFSYENISGGGDTAWTYVFSGAFHGARFRLHPFERNGERYYNLALDRNLALVQGQTGLAQLVDLETGDVVYDFGLASEITHPYFDPSGRFASVVTKPGGQFSFYSLYGLSGEQSLAAFLPLGQRRFSATGVSPDGTRAFVSLIHENQRFDYVLSTETGETIVAFQHDAIITDGPTVLGGDPMFDPRVPAQLIVPRPGGTLVWIDAHDGTVLKSFDTGKPIREAAIYGGGEIMAVVVYPDEWMLYRLGAGLELPVQVSRGNGNELTLNGNLDVANVRHWSSSATYIVRNPLDPENADVLGPVDCLFAAVGLYSVDEYPMTALHSLETGEKLGSFELAGGTDSCRKGSFAIEGTLGIFAYNASVNPDQVEIGQEGIEVVIRSIEDWSVLARLPRPSQSHITFAPDGRWLVLADLGTDYGNVGRSVSQISFVDTMSWETHARIDLPEAPTDELTDVSFTEDGAHLIVAVGDGALRVYEADPDSIVDRLCQERAGRNFSPKQWESIFGETEPWRPTCAGWE